MVKVPRGLMSVVKKSAKELDKIQPKWFRRVNIKNLKMHTSTSCILGQVFGGYWNAPQELGRMSCVGGVLLHPYYPMSRNEKSLVEAWRREVKARKN